MKKVLVISEIPTHPVHGGNQQYTLAYIDLIKQMGYDVYYFLGYEHYRSKEEFKATEKYWGDHFFYYKQNKFISFYQRVIRKTHKTYQNIIRRYAYDIDVVYMKGMNSFLKKIQRNYQFDIAIVNYIFYSKAFLAFPSTRKILVTHDVFTNRYKRTGELFFFTTSAKQEKKGLDRSDYILSIQENESIFFRYLTNKNVITGYCPVKYQDTPLCNNENILYMGSDNPFNVKGLMSFIQNVMPEITKKNTVIKLIIAGTVCEKLDKSIINNNIVLLGQVDKLEDFYNMGNIVINPTEDGSGLKIKSIEALAYNKVLISHPHATEGLYDTNNLPIISASTTQEYTDAILEFFEYTSKIREAKENAAKYMNNYNLFVKEQIKKVLYG